MKRASKDVVLPGILMIIWIVLIVIQPHLSGAVILTMICLVVILFCADTAKNQAYRDRPAISHCSRGRHRLRRHLRVEDSQSPVSYINQRFSHAARRLDTFQNRQAVSVDDRMQIEQAEIALGSGGLTGKGLGKSVQKLNCSPEAHNDFYLVNHW